ncbi:hypothetical protein C8J56DRAFT_800049, partial [Mycena floridula]
EWKKDIPLFVEELLRLDGRGDSFDTSRCPDCNHAQPRYRCPECLSDNLRCSPCILKRHHQNPLHRIEVWTEKFFFVKVSLRSIGQRIQLGHPDGSPCAVPVSSKGPHFTIIDTHATHEVSLDFCGCEQASSQTRQLLRARLFPATGILPTTAATFRALDYFQMLSFESKINLHDFYGTILRQTDNIDLKVIPKREDQLRLMVREWRHLRMLKRSGCAHHPDGVMKSASRPGALAVQCPACPHPGINLPEDWMNAPEDKKWIYSLFAGMDANFKLKRKAVSSESKDPSLSDGAAYFVPEVPYKAHLEKYKHIKQEASKCVSHDAVNSADTKDTRGLAATGVGAVDCTRHDFKLPTSMGDLQVGERYLNMDFCLFSTLAVTMVALVVLSYDIMCQYKVNFSQRMTRFPPEWRVNTGDVSFKWLIPKFHLPAHIVKCHQLFSFNFIRGVARTEGEAVERAWAKLNPLAWSTKEMGPGSRRDTLNDHIGHSNWKKVATMGECRSLLIKCHNAIPQRILHAQVLKGLEDTFTYATVLAEWKAEVESWEKDPDNVPNPFEPRVNPPTLWTVRLSLAQADADETSQWKTAASTIRSDVSASSMIVMGLELEELQYDTKDLGPHSSLQQRTKIIERSTTLRRRIKSWFEVQAIYVPGISLLRACDATHSVMTEGLPDCNAKLWLPSEIGSLLPCDPKLQKYEWDLRSAQANDSLEGIRSNLRLNAFLIKRKIDYTSGVRDTNRSDSTILKTSAKVKAHCDRYRIARSALFNLCSFIPNVSDTFFDHFKELNDEDCKPLPVDELKVGEGRTVKVITWIWTSLGENATASGDRRLLLDALRIQWLKTRARATRWDEELELLVEEMRRVNEFLHYREKWWVGQGHGVPGNSPESEGKSAYAFRQAAICQAMRERNSYLWRLIPGWIATGQVPSERNWLSNIVQPQDAPKNIFI